MTRRSVAAVAVAVLGAAGLAAALATTATADPPPHQTADFAGAWMNGDATELVVGVTTAAQIRAVEATGAGRTLPRRTRRPQGQARPERGRRAEVGARLVRRHAHQRGGRPRP